MNNYDLIVIGAGPGGYEAALHAAKLGLKTALVERRDVGGTCLNRGCIPTKTLLHSAELYHEAKEAETFGIRAENVGFDLPAIFARKQAVVEKLRGGVEGLLKSAKVEVLRGTGTVLGTGRVKVANAEGETEYTCENILCATGSVPARPPIPGLELAMSSDELLDGVLGGGSQAVSFVSPRNTNVDMVQFVLLTQGIHPPAETRTQEAVQEQNETVLDRLKDLFGLGD